MTMFFTFQNYYSGVLLIYYLYINWILRDFLSFHSSLCVPPRSSFEALSITCIDLSYYIQSHTPCFPLSIILIAYVEWFYAISVLSVHILSLLWSVFVFHTTTFSMVPPRSSFWHEIRDNNPGDKLLSRPKFILWNLDLFKHLSDTKPLITLWYYSMVLLWSVRLLITSTIYLYHK